MEPERERICRWQNKRAGEESKVEAKEGRGSQGSNSVEGKQGRLLAMRMERNVGVTPASG